jgi:hypothetical protein
VLLTHRARDLHEAHDVPVVVNARRRLQRCITRIRDCIQIRQPTVAVDIGKLSATFFGRVTDNLPGAVYTQRFTVIATERITVSKPREGSLRVGGSDQCSGLAVQQMAAQ